MSKHRKRHSPEQIVRNLRDADAMFDAGKDLAAVLQALELSEAAWNRWRNQYEGMKSEEAKRLSALDDENRRLKQLMKDLSLDNQMVKHAASKAWLTLRRDSRLRGGLEHLLTVSERRASVSLEKPRPTVSYNVPGSGRRAIGVMSTAAGDCASSAAVQVLAFDGRLGRHSSRAEESATSIVLRSTAMSARLISTASSLALSTP